MSILDRHLWKSTLQGITLAWLALVMLDGFFAFINEIGDVGGDNNYGTPQVLIFLAYSLPGRLYEFFPTAILIGALLGLGTLAANSEFTAMRAAGISIKQITFSVLKLGLLLSVLIFVLGEWIVPEAELQAKNFKAIQQNQTVTLTKGAGLWVKEKDEIIHIGKVLNEKSLADISIYRMGKERKSLGDLTTIDSARHEDEGWNLKKITTMRFKDSKILRDTVDDGFTRILVNPQILGVAAADPEQLSAQELKQMIYHQKNNNLNADRFELAFWKHFSIPLSALVMLILAMPFLFASQRSGSSGQRIFIGIIVGIVFFLANRLLNEIGIVYDFSPFVSAFFPVIIFLLIGIFTLSRIR
jgi:lipopolysaccharide export system permease protein